MKYEEAMARLTSHLATFKGTLGEIRQSARGDPDLIDKLVKSQARLSNLGFEPETTMLLLMAVAQLVEDLTAELTGEPPER